MCNYCDFTKVTRRDIGMNNEPQWAKLNILNIGKLLNILFLFTSYN